MIGILLSMAVLASYWDVLGNDFINYDDPGYVSENRHVLRGLGIDELIWAFTAQAVSNWHPLTWVSLMLDHELYGINAAGYHWTNVLLHLLTTLILFAVLKRMTGGMFCSALVAGLFAVHPLHVESVAWVAERKDVLSGLFWMLGLWGYSRYVERPGYVRYGWVMLFFVMGLLSKPMVVTFPLVLLLLDWWPLGRVDFGRLCSAGGFKAVLAERPQSGDGTVRFPGGSVGWLVMEKVPLLLLSAVSATVTFLVQKEGGAVESLQALPFSDRLANAVVSYAYYLVKTAWPFALSIFYPHPRTWPAREIILSLVLILLVTFWVISQVRRRPYLTVGWLWYLGTLVPVIGLVQVGAQAMADRYTYLPLIGIFIMTAWALKDLLKFRPVWRLTGAAVIGGMLVVLVVMTRTQVGYWKDSISLFSHALIATDHNYQAHKSLGDAYKAEGRYREALGHYREAVRIVPGYAAAFNNIGIAQMEEGSLAEAMTSNTMALQLEPENGNIRLSRAELFARQGLLVEAISEYRIALKKKPYDPALRNNLGVALVRLGNIDEALLQFREAIRLDGEHAGAHCNLGMLLMGRGEVEAAVSHFKEALRYQPQYANAHYQLALALKQRGLVDESNDHLREAQRINPDVGGRGKEFLPEKDLLPYGHLVK